MIFFSRFIPQLVSFALDYPFWSALLSQFMEAKGFLPSIEVTEQVSSSILVATAGAIVSVSEEHIDFLLKAAKLQGVYFLDSS